MLLAAILLGVIVSVLGFLLQGASAAGVSLWASLKGTVLENTLDSRFGQVWGARALDWLALGALLAGARAARRSAVPVLRPVTLGADGLALDASAAALGPRRCSAVGGLYLVFTPALGGHASVQSPVWAFFPSDVLHVLAVSVWVGGIACLLLALPAATRRLEPAERSRLLLATLARFSPLALAAVITIALTGVLQAYIDVRSLDGLLHTTYGSLIIAKTGSARGAHRSRLGQPRAGHSCAQGDRRGGCEPRRRRVLARRTLRAESLLMLCVFGVTAALISYAPPIDAASGPYSTSTALGPAVLEMTVEPARVGLNTVHLYLIDAKTGTQFTQTKELTVTARLPAKGIGPLPLHVSLAGPGHYILSSAELTPGGTWELALADRVSEFQSYSTTVKVPIR